MSNSQRRQVPIPNILWHVTKSTNRDSILLDGIVPHSVQGACYDDEIGDKDRYGVYLTSDVDALVDIDVSFQDTESLIAFQLDVSDIKDKLIPDDAFDMSVDDLFTDKDIAEGLYDQFSYRYPGKIPNYKILGYMPVFRGRD